MINREEQFEKMLQSVLAEYEDVSSKMEKLKKAGKEKTATYRQLFGTKLMLQNIISRYEVFGLIQNRS